MPDSWLLLILLSSYQVRLRRAQSQGLRGLLLDALLQYILRMYLLDMIHQKGGSYCSGVFYTVAASHLLFNPLFHTVGELPKNDERSDVECVGARFIAPVG